MQKKRKLGVADFSPLTYNSWKCSSPNLLPPHFSDNRFCRERKEIVLWEGILKEETDKYFLFGKGKYSRISGHCDSSPKFEPFDFDNYVLRGKILIAGLKKNILCFGEVGSWRSKKHQFSQNPFYDHVFEISGKIAENQEEKNLCIENHLRFLKG